jgi:hypothetical protein
MLLQLIIFIKLKLIVEDFNRSFTQNLDYEVHYIGSNLDLNFGGPN